MELYIDNDQVSSWKRHDANCTRCVAWHEMCGFARSHVKTKDLGSSPPSESRVLSPWRQKIRS
jgi:hypothetical protein